MYRLEIFGLVILIMSSHRISKAGLAKDCELVARLDREILKMEKSSIMNLQDHELNSIVTRARVQIRLPYVFHMK